MRVVDVNNLLGTDREVDCPKGGFKSLRILLEKDGMGYTLTKTFVPEGKPQHWHYKNHLETCFCIKGNGILTDLKSNQKFEINPGKVYILDQNDDHEFQALEDTILICVFNPPLKGQEVHKEDSSY